MTCVTCLLSTLIAFLLIGHVISITLSVSPDYILSGNALALNCSLERNATEPSVTFYKDATLIGYIQNCRQNGFTSCSSTTKCQCDLISNTYTWNYTPSNENENDATFNCTISTAESNRITVKKAELSDVTISPAAPVINATENTTVENIRCTALCWPECSFIWTGPSGFISYGDILRLSNIQRSNSGLYRCQATNVVGTNYSNFIDIKVQHSPDKISLFPSITNYTMIEGRSINVTCSAVCEPACDFEWTYPSYTKHNINILQIESLQGTDNGTYTCRAYNILGYKESAIMVTINFAPKAIFLSPSNSNYTKKEGDTLGSIVCSADCNPACSFTWTYPDGTKQYNESLIRYSLEKNHDGIYTCKGFNDVGYQEKKITVSINYSPDKISLFPSITNYTKSEGDSISVECSAVCEPSCDFEWTFPNYTKHNIKILQIESLQGTDNGTYTCRAYNKIGYKESAIMVTINYGPKAIVLSPSDFNYTKKEGDTLGNIVCSSECNPACSFTWAYPDGTKHYNASLHRYQLQKNHEGIYTCKAFNIVGFKEESITVTINYDPGNSIFFSPSNTNYVMMEGDTLGDITCSANCKPSCTFEWTYPNGTKYLDSTLGIGRLNRTHAGVYKCKGYNHIGSSEKTITVAVNYPPESIRLSPTNTPFIVREFTTVRVTCEADCIPTCTYQWTGQNTWTSVNRHLTLTSIRRTATGSYICRARNIINSYRYAETSVSIIVHSEYIVHLSCMKKSVPDSFQIISNFHILVIVVIW
ncbi:CD22 antigen [Mytilus galloprovincialis]|uniref:CD22 antigen n=1 Tax=Mytilus galloprovincialis TaxID=29158 RepID=A0A8B6C7Q1_MYTGA|nr:CD22 antigen [Mytilus galloprovincialis]